MTPVDDPGHLPVSQAFPDDQLIHYLEPDQLVVDTSRPLPPAAVGPTTRAALWGLRVFVMIVSAMVIYTFIVQLGG